MERLSYLPRPVPNAIFFLVSRATSSLKPLTSKFFLALLPMAMLLLVSCDDGQDTSEFDELSAMEAFEKGVEFRDQGQPQRAFVELNEALRLDPRMAEAYAARATIFIIYGDQPNAIADLNRALRLDEDLAIAYNYRGLVFADVNDMEGALLSYTKAIQLDPTLTEAYLNRADAYLKDQDLDSAIEDLTSAIETEPDRAAYYLVRGQLRLTNGQPDMAVADMEQVLALTDDEQMVVSAKEILSIIQ